MGNSQTVNESVKGNDEKVDISDGWSSQMGFPLEIPGLSRIGKARVILIAGCGGGFDFTHGLPLFFACRKLGKDVHLANLTFSQIAKSDAEILCRCQDGSRSLVKVTADTKFTDMYCPEKWISLWFREHLKDEVPVYTFGRVGPVPLRKAYKYLIETLKVDLVILVDGGSDSLMAGDEDKLGSLSEDMSSIAAVRPLLSSNLRTPCLKDALLVVLGLGADRYHGVSDAATLRAIAELTRSGGYCGSFCLLSVMEEVELYRKALEFVHRRKPDEKSIVGSFILDSISGQFGDYHSNERTEGSKLFINPLMSMFFFFDLKAVADRIKYLSYVSDATTTSEVLARALQWRDKNANIIRSVEEFPKSGDFGYE